MRPELQRTKECFKESEYFRLAGTSEGLYCSCHLKASSTVRLGQAIQSFTKKNRNIQKISTNIYPENLQSAQPFWGTCSNAWLSSCCQGSPRVQSESFISVGKPVPPLWGTLHQCLENFLMRFTCSRKLFPIVCSWMTTCVLFILDKSRTDLEQVPKVWLLCTLSCCKAFSHEMLDICICSFLCRNFVLADDLGWFSGGSVALRI